MLEEPKTNHSDLHGLAKLAIDATINVTNLVEEVHHRVVHPPFLPSTPIQHLITDVSGLVYNQVRQITKWVGRQIDQILTYVNPLLVLELPLEQREVAKSILNGVIGDYLEEQKNPLAISMQFRVDGQALSLNPTAIQTAYSSVNEKLLVVVHGLCMNDLQWESPQKHHVTSLAQELNFTPIYLNYNTGQGISDNGQSLHQLLEQLVQNWPVPVQEITFLTHSMGGLVSRSAFYHGQQTNNTWTKLVQNMVFLGTPHHGAPLEQIGSYIDTLLDSFAYTKPFSSLGKIRSVGITDLRYGNATPLPKEVNCYAIAATIAKGATSNALLGDGLVPISSALGQHSASEYQLHFLPQNTKIITNCHHIELLNHEEVYQSIYQWLVKE